MEHELEIEKRANVEAFCAELTALSLRFNIYIGGCGCCGSPYLTSDENHAGDGDLGWNNMERAYKFTGGLESDW